MHTDLAKYFNINVISKPGFPGGSAVKNSFAKQEMQVWYGGWEDPLEKGMATCSSILAWENPGTGESCGSQKRHDFMTKTTNNKQATI